PFERRRITRYARHAAPARRRFAGTPHGALLCRTRDGRHHTTARGTLALARSLAGRPSRNPAATCSEVEMIGAVAILQKPNEFCQPNGVIRGGTSPYVGTRG